MTTAEFTEFLIAEIEATGDRTWVEEMLQQARKRLLDGNGMLAPLESGSINGRNVNKRIVLHAGQVAQACRAALDYTDPDDQTGVSASRLDFRDL